MTTNKHRITVNPKLTLDGPGGARVEIDLNLGELKATAEQKKIVSKLLASGDHASLTDDERNKIKDLKVMVGLGTPVSPAGIVSFNWNWFEIDPPTRGGKK